MISCNLKNHATEDSMLPQLQNIMGNLLYSYQNYYAGMTRYSHDFYLACLLASIYFNKSEFERLQQAPFSDNFNSYQELFMFNRDLAARAMGPAYNATMEFTWSEMQRFIPALLKAFLQCDSSELEEVSARQAKLTSILSEVYPKAIAEIEPEFGFHFERGHDPLVEESPRFRLYQVMPTDPNVTVKKDGKPILILPPYVLGANILGFLPGEQRSYTHCFANQGIPTYIRVLKDIAECEPLQVMTGEDDALDTQAFCKTIKERHGKPVTLNGYCQGGFSGLCNILSGKLDGLVDAFLTCVAPMDGTCSKGLSGFLKSLPKRFNDLTYGTKILDSGNQVADGRLMGWVYKLKSIELEEPTTAFHRDLMMFSRNNVDAPRISKTAAAINYWLLNERRDLPMAITEMSFASFNTPITDDGVLPVKLFGQELCLKRIEEKKIPWLICYGLHDDLVEVGTALAPQKYINVELTPFPKGHVAIATSWSDPRSEYALHKRYKNGKYRGPVRFQLDLDAEFDKKMK